MRRTRGFTLFEIMLAIALLVALSSTLFSFMLNLMSRRDRLIEASRDGRSGSSLIERLENDIFGAIAGDATIGAGIDGGENRLTLLTRTVNVPSGPDELDWALGDLQSARYVFDDASSEVRTVRRAIVPGGSVSEADDEVVSSRVRRLRFRYHDGQTWLSSYNSLQRNGLPVAIEVAIWFGDPPPRPALDADSPGSAGDETPLQFGADFPEEPFIDAGQTIEGDVLLPTFGEPDRLRVIVVPDGPVAAWKGGR